MSQWKDDPPKGVNQFTESQLRMKKPQSMRVLGRPCMPPHRPPRLGQVPASPPKFTHQQLSAPVASVLGRVKGRASTQAA